MRGLQFWLRVFFLTTVAWFLGERREQRRRGSCSHLHAELVVEVSKAQQLRPHAFVGREGVHADVAAHRVELGTEHGVSADVVPAESETRNVQPGVSPGHLLLHVKNQIRAQRVRTDVVLTRRLNKKIYATNEKLLRRSV